MCLATRFASGRIKVFGLQRCFRQLKEELMKRPISTFQTWPGERCS